MPAPLVLPSVSINTTGAAPIVSKEDYLTGVMTITDGRTAAVLSTGALEIRGRGNSTWAFPKKPYRIKYTNSTPQLGMPSSKHWVLLANYADKTLLRNDVVFELGRQLGHTGWVPRSQTVDVTINGSYEGVYQLVEQIRVDKNRVNITEMKVGDTTGSAVTGGYLIEVDERLGEDFCFIATRTGRPFCLNTPETLLEAGWSAQRQYIQEYINNTEAALYGAQFDDPTVGYAAWLDVDSAVDFYLLQELVRNADAMRYSTFLNKPRNGKLAFGPLWDFDLVIGNAGFDGVWNPEGWSVRNQPWFARLYEDPAFRQKVKQRWDSFKADGKLAALYAYIDSRAFDLKLAQEKNFQRWPIFNIDVFNNPALPGSYDGEIGYMKGWLAQRVAWFDANLTD
ncbi:hypothetical protein BH09PSE6_BH09PSE6_01380 [soil metagenome]